MSLGESILFATVMTLLDEVKSKEQKSTTTATKPVENNIDIKFTFENLKAKDKLIALADKLFAKADEKCNTFTENDTPVLISSLITAVIYECVKSASADYEMKNRVYDYAVKYCNVQTDFTWGALNVEDGGQLENVLKQLGDMAFNMIFVASTVSSDEEISTEFIRLLTELMMHLEDSVKLRFPSFKFENRLPVVALDFVIGGMDREMHRLEEEDPSLKENAEPPIDTDRIAELRNDAREALSYEDTNRAAAYYRQIANLNPNDWEAVFYKEFCPAFNPPERVSTIRIQDNTKRISEAMAQAMPLAKKQILIRPQLIADVGDVCAWLSKIAANYFVATMNEFRSSSQGMTDNTRKSNQVYWIIQMLFSCGDAIEQNFSSDVELCKNLCVACWKIAFDCYENCNMNAPSNLYDYYQKMLKYEPSFRCSKPLVGSNKGNGTDGCYVATAVYGSYDCPQVWTLRRFRDFSLKRSFGGRLFVRVYYAVSPTLVKLFGKTKWFNSGCQKMLDKFVARLQSDGYEDTPYNDR